MQRPGFRKTEIQDHGDNEDRRPEDREENDCHDRNCYPGNVRAMVDSVVIGRNLQVFADLLFDPALKIVARRTACRGDGSRGRKVAPGETVTISESAEPLPLEKIAPQQTRGWESERSRPWRARSDAMQVSNRIFIMVPLRMRWKPSPIWIQKSSCHLGPARVIKSCAARLAIHYCFSQNCGCSSVVEHLLAKEDVASSTLVTRSSLRLDCRVKRRRAQSCICGKRQPSPAG